MRPPSSKLHEAGEGHYEAGEGHSTIDRVLVEAS